MTKNKTAYNVKCLKKKVGNEILNKRDKIKFTM